LHQFPAVTTVVPTHNRPQLMQRAVESVLRQDYEGEIEVIIVFDACAPFRPPVELPEGRTLRVVENHRSRGLAGARNTGILEAQHDYVAFLDDDDHWLPGKLAAQMRQFADSTNVDLVGTAMVLDDGRRTYERLVPKTVVNHADLLRDRMAGLHSSTFVFRKAALLGRVGLVDEELPGSYGEDYDLLLRTAMVSPIVVVNEPLVSVTWAASSYFFGRWGAYAEGLEYLVQTHPGFESDKKAYRRIASQIAFARAANGDRAVARSWAGRSLRNGPTQPKAWLALAISLRLVRVETVTRLVQRMGKGI
jgi:glycosyltransferase involved in cell wall biosynthesis